MMLIIIGIIGFAAGFLCAAWRAKKLLHDVKLPAERLYSRGLPITTLSGAPKERTRPVFSFHDHKQNEVA